MSVNSRLAGIYTTFPAQPGADKIRVSTQPNSAILAILALLKMHMHVQEKGQASTG